MGVFSFSSALALSGILSPAGVPSFPIASHLPAPFSLPGVLSCLDILLLEVEEGDSRYMEVDLLQRFQVETGQSLDSITVFTSL